MLNKLLILTKAFITVIIDLENQLMIICLILYKLTQPIQIFKTLGSALKSISFEMIDTEEKKEKDGNQAA
jgi:hypothetical protein